MVLNALKFNLKTLVNGLLQGGILSHILLNIHFNDIPKSQSTYLALFADDTAVFAMS